MYPLNRVNILNKHGMLTDEDRKERLEHGCQYFTFKSNLDLSDGIKVIPYGTWDEYPIEKYSQDVASFFCWWNMFVMEDLNGFPGMSHIKFELVGFTLK